jgi:uncharacterized protein (DUF2235 family)
MPLESRGRKCSPLCSTSLGDVVGSKNIVICCDGTGNEFGDANSNFVNLYTAIAIDNDQVGYGHLGVLKMGDPAQRHHIIRCWSKVKGLAFAAGALLAEGSLVDT